MGLLQSRSEPKVVPTSTEETIFVIQTDNPEDLPAKLVIGCNVVVCQAAVNPSGDTVVALVTPDDVPARRLHVTSNSSFAKVLRCGEDEGQRMEAPNSTMKMVAVNFGKEQIATIQFLKEKELSCQYKKSNCLCFEYTPEDYGTILIPKSLRGHLIVFFWPDDYIGDGFRNFLLDPQTTITTQDRKSSKKHSEKERSPGCALTTDEDAERLCALFKLC